MHSSPLNWLRSRRSRWPRRAAALVLTVVAVLLILNECGIIGPNIRTVDPGRLYRSARLPPPTLERLIRERGIRTVVTLEAGSVWDDWYREEIEVCRRMGVKHLDISMPSTALPSPDALQRLVEQFDTAEYPMVFHCRRGADRSGLVAALYRHLHEGVPLDEAERQEMTWRYGHLHVGAARVVRSFFRVYREDRSGLDLRTWIHTRYPEVYENRRGRTPVRTQVPPAPVSPALARTGSSS